MECVKERAISLLATEKSQPIGEDTSLQTQKNQSQIIGPQQESTQQQFEKLQLLPLVGQPIQNNESQPQQMTKPSQPVVKETSQPIQQNQKDESQPQQMTKQSQKEDKDLSQQQMTKQSQKEDKDLSLISQEEMQQQQYEKFKQLMSSVKQKYHDIEVLK
jgi:hypothetical protein